MIRIIVIHSDFVGSNFATRGVSPVISETLEHALKSWGGLGYGAKSHSVLSLQSVFGASSCLVDSMLTCDFTLCWLALNEESIDQLNSWTSRLQLFCSIPN